MEPTPSLVDSTTDENPLISVIVPVYNVAPFLPRCVESILTQDYTHLELILVDDGSTDTSWEICQKYSKKETRVVARKQANAGSSVARNTGLELAQGEFIAFVDSDDWIDRKMLKMMVSYALEHNLAVVECDYVRSTSLNQPPPPKFPDSFVETQEQAMERLIRDKNFSVWRRIYRKDCINALRFIPGKIHQDVFFSIDVINSVAKQGYIPKQLYIYNSENESVTRSPYNLKKLDAKDAPYYVFEGTKDYSPAIRTLGRKYLIRSLLSHYDRLFLHSHLDKDLKYRKTIRKEIKTQLGFQNSNSFASLLATTLPFWAYGTLLRLNALRIKIKLTYLKR